MKKKLLCLLLSVILLITIAEAAEKPNATVDVSRSCTLTLQYAASEQTVRLYHVADIYSSGHYTLCGVFSDYGIHMSAGNSQAEWDALRDTLLACIAADALAPDNTAVTGADGKAEFTGLSAGIYLVDKIDMGVGGSTYQYAASLLAIPGTDGDGAWAYDVTAAPKHTEKPSGGGDAPSTSVTYTVVKLWSGEKDLNKRPSSVEITIYKNGVEQEKQILSSVNDWSYQWTASDGTWNVWERNVPKDYTVTIQCSGNHFFVTNTQSSSDPTPTPNPTPPPSPEPGDRPQTGDESHLTLYAILMAASGMALLLIGMVNRKQKHEKE